MVNFLRNNSNSTKIYYSIQNNAELNIWLYELNKIPFYKTNIKWRKELKMWKNGSGDGKERC